MNKETMAARGIELLVKKCRAEFRCAENTDYYTESGYNEAERKYIKYCLYGNTNS